MREMEEYLVDAYRTTKREFREAQNPSKKRKLGENLIDIINNYKSLFGISFTKAKKSIEYCVEIDIMEKEEEEKDRRIQFDLTGN